MTFPKIARFAIAGTSLLVLALVGVQAGQRIRVIDSDNSATPLAST